MLNFSKTKVLFIYLLLIITVFFAFLNFQRENIIIDKKVNLGLDLQGGSYLLLEIDNVPLIKERIQNKAIPLKKLLRDNNIIYENFSVNSNKIIFNTNQNNIDKFEKLFFTKKNNIANLYIDKYIYLVKTS